MISLFLFGNECAYFHVYALSNFLLLLNGYGFHVTDTHDIGDLLHANKLS